LRERLTAEFGEDEGIGRKKGNIEQPTSNAEHRNGD